MPKPITFVCEQELSIPPMAVFEKMRDVSTWSTFDGYLLLPGIEQAEYEVETAEIAGSVIRLHNSDGSTHTETIVEWTVPNRIVLRLGEFSPPLNRLATHFDETWTFEERAGRSFARREFAMYAKSAAAKIPLFLISYMMRRAVAAHFKKIAQ